MKLNEMLKNKGGKEKKKKEKKIKLKDKEKSKKVGIGTKTNNENNEKSMEEQGPDIQITDKELECDDSELYPAEMVYWRSLAQCYLKAKFICVVAYEHKSHRMIRKRDRIYMEAKCKVIRPDFITNLKQQRIDFENCVISSSLLKIVTIQNITYHNIKPQVSLLNPLGCFSIHYAEETILPPEQTMKLYIEFKPKDVNEATEYFEIKSSTTIIPLILCGKGSHSDIRISPEYEVYRMETKMTKLAELQLKIQNLSECEAKIDFNKIFEIEANLTDIKEKTKEEKPIIIANDKLENNEKNPKKHKDKKIKEKKVKEPKEKLAKYSNNLTEKEIEAIEKCFKKIKASGSHFELKSPESYLKIQPNATANLTIFCGEPEVIYSKKYEAPKKAKKDKRENKKETRKDNKEITEKQSSVKSSTKILEDKQYISQYNIQMGTMHIKSVIIICTIKC